MKNRHKLLPIIALFALVLGGCSPRVFGVDETVWTTLSESEREKVIEGYNKQKEKELENERHRLEIEAQTAPIYAAADAISNIWGKSQSKSQRKNYNICIESVSSSFSKNTLTIGGDIFELSPFSKKIDTWVKGQSVELTANDSLMYPIKIRNFDNGETVIAKKAKFN